MDITIDKGSAIWISEDLKIILYDTLSGSALFVLAFPRMNCKEVEEASILRNDSFIEGSAIPLPKGIYGRYVHLDCGMTIDLPLFRVDLKLKDSESARERATFEVNISSENPMQPIECVRRK